MKTVQFIKTNEPAFDVQVKVDIVSTLVEMQEAGFERMMTIMELDGLTDTAIAQGLDFQLMEGSYMSLIAKGKAANATSIVLRDFTSSGSAVLHTFVPKAIVATDDSKTGVDGDTGETGVLNVLTNDTMDGSQATTSNVQIKTISNDSEGAVILNNDGSVDVGIVEEAATYNLVYQICELASPFNCATAEVTIGVTVA